MEFFKKAFRSSFITLYPLGDWHYGSPQCDIDFIKLVVERVAADPHGVWVGMGDLMENALISTPGDIYSQLMPPKDQMEDICKILYPIRKQGLFLISGNHEQRTMKLSGIIPEQYISSKLELPYLGFSAMAVLQMDEAHRSNRSFSAYFHHNYGGGRLAGSKVNCAERLREIAPNVDAIFSGHMHITSRVPRKWFEPGEIYAMERIGYDYLTGSALTWNRSYAEQKGLGPSVVEHIRVMFHGSKAGSGGKYQEYGVLNEGNLTRKEGIQAGFECSQGRVPRAAGGEPEIVDCDSGQPAGGGRCEGGCHQVHESDAGAPEDGPGEASGAAARPQV